MVKILDGLLTGTVVFYLWRYLDKQGSLSFAKGIIVLFLIKGLSEYIGLSLFSEIVNYLVLATLFSVPFIFQNEIRQIYGRLGNIKFRKNAETPRHTFMHQLMKSVKRFSNEKTGALIVIQNADSLESIEETGVHIDSELRYELLCTIFENQSILHDGAVVVNKNRINAARCILPLSDDRNLNGKYGTRHRAAKGISELKDCVVIVVSEETGEVSIVRNGIISTYKDLDGFRSALEMISEREEVVKKGMMEILEELLEKVNLRKGAKQ